MMNTGEAVEQAGRVDLPRVGVVSASTLNLQRTVTYLSFLCYSKRKKLREDIAALVGSVSVRLS